MDTIVHYNFDQYKQQGYATNFCDNNFKNNFNIGIVNIGIERDQINSSCVYSNINNLKYNLVLCYLSVIGSIKVQALIPNLPRSDIIDFHTKSQPILLNY